MFEFFFFCPSCSLNPIAYWDAAWLFFFPLCLFHFPFYYLPSLTMPSHFSLSIPQPAAGMLGHPDAGVLARSAFLLFCICPLKTVSGKFPLLCAFRKRKASIPVLAIKPKKLLSSLVCMAGERTGPPAPTPRGVSSLFFFFWNRLVQFYQKLSQKKAPGRGKASTRWPTPQGSPHQTALTGHLGKEIHN